MRLQRPSHFAEVALVHHVAAERERGQHRDGREADRQRPAQVGVARQQQDARDEEHETDDQMGKHVAHVENRR